MTKKTPLDETLRTLFDLYVRTYKEVTAKLPVCEYDEEWKSPCMEGEVDNELICWKPTRLNERLSFENIESALEIKLHSDIVTYYTSYYSNMLNLTCDEGDLSLLFPWNKNDFERLQENIIGHVLMKLKLKQPITIFFAVTDDDDYILSIDNETGSVWVERVGCIAHKKLANTLSEFLSSLDVTTPTLSQ